ncbi:MAG: hypothetical protein J6R85_04380 [Lentisphaeria bacterium]|nr:hypothetical protein [Lentisphaeria bacterium]
MTHGDTIGALMVEAARENGYLDGPIAVIPELAEQEKQLFIRMMRELQKYLERNERQSLEQSEVESMFTFVLAKAGEMVALHLSNSKQDEELSLDGLFDGKIPMYADDTLLGFANAAAGLRWQAPSFGTNGSNRRIRCWRCLKR